MSLQEYENILLGCSEANSESVFQNIADRYEDDLLNFDDFPEDYFNFIIKLLSDSRFYSKAGVWNFLLVLSTEFHRLSTQHYNRLAEIFVDNYKNYQDEDLCLAVCDFIARNYNLNKAEQIFSRLDPIEKLKPESLQGFVADGRRIMLAEDERKKKGK